MDMRSASLSHPPATNSANLSSHRAWILAGLAPFLSLAVVRPWKPEAFPVWDFCDMLPHFRRAGGFLNTFIKLVEIDRPNGLARHVDYAHFAATWVIGGDNPVAWQWQRAILMLLAAVLIVVAARRLGATPLAAAIGATLFTLAVPSTEGWLFLMAEPLGLVMMLLFFVVGAGYTTAMDWRRRAVILALLAFAVMSSKEVLGVTLPAMALFAVTWVPGQGFRRPELGSRTYLLAGLLALVLILQLWIVFSVLNQAPAGSYARSFGGDHLALDRFSTRFQAMLLPTRYSSAAASTALYPSNLAFLLLLILGLARPASNPPRPAGWWLGVAGLLTFPVIGALAYALWPRYSAFYGIPFFAGSIGLLILMATSVERAHRWGRWIVGGLGTVAIWFSALAAHRTIQQKHAIAGLAVEVVTALRSEPRLDTLYVVLPRQGGRRWPVTGSELRRYAVALQVADSALPVVRDLSCEEIIARLQRPLANSAVLNDQNPCGRLPGANRTWVRETKYLDWVSAQVRVDTTLVEVLAPAWSPGGRSP